ncbi:MAG TPA: hypothetical protein VGL73_04505 [Caulobacteraceae bacterium]|jgi:hypothetical protein
MTEPIRPVDRISRPRRVGRAMSIAGRRASDQPVARLPVKTEPAADEPTPPPPAGPAAFAAQVMGQGGQKRGLRGGPETLDHARAAYLETEWSGPADRRPPPGRIAKTEI